MGASGIECTWADESFTAFLPPWTASVPLAGEDAAPLFVRGSGVAEGANGSIFKMVPQRAA
ncbi:hypothetical protein GmRootV11_41120 [Variovorax sp. V11]